MKVLVIIVSYNFERWIDRCLGSLRESEHPADVIVIDNLSQDRTLELVKANYPEVRLIACDKNLGFGQANNIGMRIALQEGYDAVFLLNQDAWIDPQTIGTLLRLSQEHPEYGILSPVHLTGSADKPDSGFATYAGISQMNDLRQNKSIIPASFINAAFWMIPTTALRNIGGFSPLFYHYGEDKDYTNRMTYHNYLIGYSPNVFGCHDREYRSISREGFLRSEQIYLLTEYANINRSFINAFAYGVLAGIKKSLKAAISGDVKGAGAYMAITFRLLGRTAEVISYRKLNSKKLSNYIQQ